MERGGDEFLRFHKLAKSSSGSSITRHGNSSNFSSNGSNTNSDITPPPVVCEQDQFMPIANVIRIMRRMLPPHAKISDGAKDAIQECVSEFISFITGEANEHCQLEHRKTITADDLLWAMEKLGFDDYIEPLSVFLVRYREAENGRTSLPGEPTLKRGIDQGPMIIPPFNSSAFQAGFCHGFMDATTNDIAGGYNRDASGTAAAAAGSSSQAPTNNFDPFSLFK
ncbi:nuclear transcription factor Y subunit B-9-like [Hibiscus syriacus]|uniref:nuclear transcription factor Y subunit B-9-like n=1 Tax=Hibiscus syriacus TaxID=106335 RepID=UPI001923CBCC|nr:nuclear transcription factor Y subunit B-9-like [Hibiscus syriacus]